MDDKVIETQVIGPGIPNVPSPAVPQTSGAAATVGIQPKAGVHDGLPLLPPNSHEASLEPTLEPDGVYDRIGRLPPGAIVTEDGLATLLGKNCRETVKRAVERGELPPPIKLMGRNCWTAGRIVGFLERRLEAAERKISRL
jgi:hypothetical protein